MGDEFNEWESDGLAELSSTFLLVSMGALGGSALLALVLSRAKTVNVPGTDRYSILNSIIRHSAATVTRGAARYFTLAKHVSFSSSKDRYDALLQTQGEDRAIMFDLLRETSADSEHLSCEIQSKIDDYLAQNPLCKVQQDSNACDMPIAQIRAKLCETLAINYEIDEKKQDVSECEYEDAINRLEKQHAESIALFSAYLTEIKDLQKETHGVHY